MRDLAKPQTSYKCWKLQFIIGLLICLVRYTTEKAVSLIGKDATATIINVNMAGVTVLSFEGMGSVDIIFEASESDQVPKVPHLRSIFIYESKWALMPKVDGNFNLKIRCRKGTDCKLSAQLLSAESDRIFTPTANNMHLSLDIPKREEFEFSFFVGLNKVAKLSEFSKPNFPKLRFESLAQQAAIGSSDGYFTKDSQFSMEVFEKGKQSTISKQTTEFGMSLYATLDPQDPEYDWSEDAVYRVKMRTKSISFGLFTLRLIPDVQILDLSKSKKTYSEVRSISDQVYKSSVNKYEIILPKFTSIQLDLVPVEGNPDIFINPDESLGWDSLKYKYKSEKDIRESITITETELKLNKYKGERLFIVVSSNQESTYMLNLELHHGDYADARPRGLRPNTFYSGTVMDRQVINYVLEFDVAIPETVNVFLSLKARTGNPDLYIKDCQEYTSCEFKLDEIERLVKLDKEIANEGLDDNGMYFRYSDNLQDTDDLFLEMNMVPHGATKYTEITGNPLPNFNNNLKISKANQICVAILGHTNSLSKSSEYTLIAKTRGTHGVVGEYRSEFIFLGPSDEQYFIYSPVHLPEEALGIIAKFDVAQGDASVYFSSATKFPNSKSNDQDLEIDNNQTLLESRTLYMQIPRSKLSSQVYFGVIAKKQTLVNMLISYWIPEQKPGESIRLIPGVPLIRRVSKVNKFSVKLFKSEKDSQKKDAFIKTVSVFGLLKKCAALVRNSADSVTKDDCISTSFDDLLLIPFHTVDSDQSDWVIFVEPSTPEGTSNVANYNKPDHSIEYRIELLSSRSIAPLNDDGSVTEGSVTDSEGILHYYDFWLDDKTKHVWLHVQSLTNEHIMASASMNKSEIQNIAKLGGEDSYWENNKNEHTFIFKAEDIRPFCELPSINSRTPPPSRLRLLQSDEEPQVVLKVLHPSTLCRIFVKITARYVEKDTSVLNPKPYRVTFSKGSDTIKLKQGKRYSLPSPLSAPMKISCDAGKFVDGVSVSVKSFSSNIQATLDVKLVSQVTNETLFETNKVINTGRYSQQLVLPPESFQNVPNGMEPVKTIATLVLEKLSDQGIIYEQPAPDPSSPVNPFSALDVMFEGDVNILEIGIPVEGLAPQSNLLFKSQALLCTIP